MRATRCDAFFRFVSMGVRKRRPPFFLRQHCALSTATTTATTTTTTTTPTTADASSSAPSSWHFSVELNTPSLQGPLTCAAGGACQATCAADSSKWGLFMDSTVPSIAALKPMFVTLPCKEPYFLSTHTGSNSTSSSRPGSVPNKGQSGAAAPLSTSQATAQELTQRFGVPVMLTVNATIHPCGDGPHLHRVGQVAVNFSDAIESVVTDFVDVRGGCHVLAVRGDDCSRRCTPTGTTGIGQRAHVSSAALLKLVRRALASTRSASTCPQRLLAVAGYPQGHITQRQWGNRNASHDIASSLAFLSDWEARYRAVASLPSSHAAPVADSHGADVEGEQTSTAAAQLAARVAVIDMRVQRCHLIQDLYHTQSSYASTTRRVNIETELVQEKLLPCLSQDDAQDEDSHSPRVAILSQLTFSAEEFLQYERDVHRALEDALGRSKTHSNQSQNLQRLSSSSSSSRGVCIAAGVLVPPIHDASQALALYLGMVMRVKVMPSAALADAVEHYSTALASSLKTARDVLSRSSAVTSKADMACALEAVEVCVREQDALFCQTWWQETVHLLVALVSSSSQRHVHFFPVGAGPAVGANIASLVCAVEAVLQ